MTLASILDAGDVNALTAALAADPALANAPVVEGDHAPHPIHALCDRVFDGRLSEGAALPMVQALIKAGADLDHVHAANGDGLVTSAISLSCPQIAQTLLDAGAQSGTLGLFAATPLHWAAIMGMPALVERLIADGGDVVLRDVEFGSTSLGWAMEGWASPPKGSRGGQVACPARLVEAGAVVEPQWAGSERVRADAAMAAALGLG